MMNVRNLILGGSLASVLGLASLAGCGSDNNSGPKTYTQIDRLARPAVNEVLATVANNRHAINDTAVPSQDGQSGFLTDDIQTFMTTAAGRSQATTDAVKSVLVPDVLVADLSQTGQAAYLGVETGGFTGGTFGGRKLTDDVVDVSLGVIFGGTVPALFPAVPDDGKEIPTLTTDNVSYTTAPKHYQDGVVSAAVFPYLGPAQ
ncbi:MAG: hypothetical protein JWL77_3793 [Chthonomonadaceae bacterium]|nr:hypothetical protein [Chthonomonadaceae bacterium]